MKFVVLEENPGKDELVGVESRYLSPSSNLNQNLALQRQQQLLLMQQRRKLALLKQQKLKKANQMLTPNLQNNQMLTPNLQNNQMLTPNLQSNQNYQNMDYKGGGFSSEKLDFNPEDYYDYDERLLNFELF